MLLIFSHTTKHMHCSTVLTITFSSHNFIEFLITKTLKLCAFSTFQSSLIIVWYLRSDRYRVTLSIIAITSSMWPPYVSRIRTCRPIIVTSHSKTLTLHHRLPHLSHTPSSTISPIIFVQLYFCTPSIFSNS